MQSAIEQALALSKAPLDLVRGTGGEEKVLKNAKDACATEALEIATYTAIESCPAVDTDRPRSWQRRFARTSRRCSTASWARSQRWPRPSSMPRYATGPPTSSPRPAPPMPCAARARPSRRPHGAPRPSAKRSARRARKVPGVAQLEGEIKGALASEDDLPIAGYGKLSATEIVERLTGLSQIDLAKIDAYERKNDDRTTVISRITSLRTSEPWPGYDELNVNEIRAILVEREDDDLAKSVRSYERSHKHRAGILAATERDAAHA